MKDDKITKVLFFYKRLYELGEEISQATQQGNYDEVNFFLEQRVIYMAEIERFQKAYSKLGTEDREAIAHELQKILKQDEMCKEQLDGKLSLLKKELFSTRQQGLVNQAYSNIQSNRVLDRKR